LVLEELGQIESERPRGKKLMLDLLLQRSTRIEHPTMHTDNALLEVASSLNIPILTVDSQLKRQSFEKGIGIIEVLHGKNIRLIESL
jgi:rRNA-processing protein FCF1